MFFSGPEIPPRTSLTSCSFKHSALNEARSQCEFSVSSDQFPSQSTARQFPAHWALHKAYAKHASTIFHVILIGIFILTTKQLSNVS